jgi:SAM-dependent methyltransferase
MKGTLPPYQARIADLLESDAHFRGRILDIGCSNRIPDCMKPPIAKAEQLDGVDPCDSILVHAGLTERWHEEFELAKLPIEAYDAAYAYNVVEHVRSPRDFIATLARVLKPGGVFWAITPNGRHPFAVIVRTVQSLRMKNLFRNFNHGINDYPAYYRLNTEPRIRALAVAHGLVPTAFHYFMVPGWEAGYLPVGMRWIARSYEETLARHYPDRRLVLAFRLQKCFR